MATYIVLYNPKAGSGTCEVETKKLNELLKEDELHFYDVTKTDYAELFSHLKSDDRILISGGDGTLNRFVNDTRSLNLKNDVYYFATGSGNDFLHDLGVEKGSAPVLINEYITNLPQVIVNGKNYLFLNGIGFGIDGYCCEVGDKLRETATKPVNYTAIAIKGLLFHYKTTSATVTVDGVAHRYDKVWLAPTMNGRFYGGGMIPTPNQTRLGGDGSASVMIMYGTGKLKTLMVFPSIFKGEHVKQEKMVAVLTGNEITVEFDRPTALQIDGETILGVTKYTVLSRALANQAEEKQSA